MRSSIHGNSLMGCSQAERALAKLEGGAAMFLKLSEGGQRSRIIGLEGKYGQVKAVLVSQP